MNPVRDQHNEETTQTKPASSPKRGSNGMNRLLEKYRKEAAPALQKEFELGNVHQIPAITKIVVSAGVGRAAADSKYLEQMTGLIAKITGQKPVKTIAKKSIAGFKLREGNAIGVSVTLRGDRMYDFLDRLISITLPRIRDFHGVSAAAFDPKGNYSLGVSDPSIFPELSYEEAGLGSGLQVNIVTSAPNAEQGRKLLELVGFPMQRSN